MEGMGGIFIGAVLGGLASLAITHFYWVKSKTTEEIIKRLSGQVQYYFHSAQYPEFYAPSTKKFDVTDGREKVGSDKPFVDYLKLNKDRFVKDEKAKGLISILDYGRNFNIQTGLSVFVNNQPVPAEFCGFGFARFECQLDPAQGSHVFKFILTDDQNNSNEQTMALQYDNGVLKK